MASDGAEQGLTQREAAARLGCSVGTVNTKVQNGELRRLPNGRIDPASLSPDLLAAPPPPGAPRSTKGRTVAQARAQREELAVEITALDLAERTRQVVAVAAVEAEQFEMARRLRDALLALPAQLAPALINLQDPRHIETTLRRAFTDFLTGQATALHDEPPPA